MTGSTITEKIVSRAVGRKARAGDLLESLPIDKLYFNEVIGPPAILNFEKDFEDVFTESGKKMQVFNPSRIAFMPDHTVPSCSIKVSQGIRLMADFAKDQGIEMYKEGDGIEHTVASEEAFVLPGEIAVATDSHTCTQGALGSLAFGIGTTEGENLLATGELYSFTVPETIRFRVSGKLQRGVYAKDLVLHVLGMMGEGGSSKRVAEYTGPTIDSLDMEGRFTICNLSVEMSARTAIVNPDQKTVAYVNEALARRKMKMTDEIRGIMAKSDPDAVYAKTVDVDASQIEPTVSLPHSPANAKPVTQVSDPIDTVFLGSCANAREADLTVAAKILKGRKVGRDTDLIVIPASRKVYNWAMDQGLLKVFADAGANIESSNCGPCFGKHMGILGPGDRCLSTSNRNYKGRMGSPEAFIYLGSPAVAAATAVEGRIADPRKYLPAGEN
ncbi:MAG TPA: aconitase/3-isopropylmalate dehydratase large subunit family protein [Nitrososphaerales archaeon]|nr:aconitase/3-isopropylmalate dehydratase large subunit family protein [Nitrososphaerales archaeon]